MAKLVRAEANWRLSDSFVGCDCSIFSSLEIVDSRREMAASVFPASTRSSTASLQLVSSCSASGFSIRSENFVPHEKIFLRK